MSNPMHARPRRLASLLLAGMTTLAISQAALAAPAKEVVMDVHPTYAANRPQSEILLADTVYAINNAWLQTQLKVDSFIWSGNHIQTPRRALGEGPDGRSNALHRDGHVSITQGEATTSYVAHAVVRVRY